MQSAVLPIRKTRRSDFADGENNMRFPLNIGDFNLRKNGDQNLQINSIVKKTIIGILGICSIFLFRIKKMIQITILEHQ